MKGLLYVSGESPTPITQEQANTKPRMSSGLGEFDRVLGGGVVDGSLVLVGGYPGIRKSTLMLQMAFRVASEEGPVLYLG